MTDQVLAESVHNQNSSADAVPAHAENNGAQKAFSQAELDFYVKKAKADAYERAKREALELQQQHNAAPIAPATAQPAQSVGGMTQMTPDQIQRMIDEQMQKRLMDQQQEMAVRQFTQQYEQKVLSGKGKYDDYDDVIGQLNLPELAKTNGAFIFMTGGLDNTPDALYEMGKHPQKLATILQLTQNPATHHMARQELQKLSDSIKQNQVAVQQHNNSASEPLSQIKSSTTGTDNGSMSVRDWRNHPGLRG